MIQDNVLFRPVELKMPVGMEKGSSWVREPMKTLACVTGVRVPVIQEQVMQHSRPGSRNVVQTEGAAPFIIDVGYVAAVVITIRSSMMRVVLHPQDDRALKQITEIPAKLKIIHSLVPDCTYSPGFFTSLQKKQHDQKSPLFTLYHLLGT